MKSRDEFDRRTLHVSVTSTLRSGEVQATELYDYADGLIETKNIAEPKDHLHKPYKNPSFRGPHLDMFKNAQE